MKRQKVYIITGLSGSGKSTAMQAFEDAGFYCVDNMPMALVPKFLELPLKENEEIKGIAFVMDMRSKTFIKEYAPGIRAIEDLGVFPQIVFLEAGKDVLQKRFSQTRRHHPLSMEASLIDSIALEQKYMEPIKLRAHHVIDTSGYNVHDLKTRILDLISDNDPAPRLMKINVQSFGFKYGIPQEADLVVDVRFLANPYFVPKLKNQDGESLAVKEFVLSNPVTRQFLNHYTGLLDYLIPLYGKENKAYLTIGVGCTGGRHRSVAIARSIFQHLDKKGLFPGIIHRDIDRDTIEQ